MKEVKLTIHSRWNWISKDRSGKIYLSAERPTINRDKWVQGGTYADFAHVAPDDFLKTMEKLEWNESLHKIEHI